jgi:flagella basal body P-ring formation protein FlgA
VEHSHTGTGTVPAITSPPHELSRRPVDPTGGNHTIRRIFSLPTGTVSNINDEMGKVLKNSIGAGQALRENQIQAAFSIKQGQTVKVISKGPGFSVSAEGKAINNASPGQVVQVRMESGQVISATAKADGTIEISN